MVVRRHKLPAHNRIAIFVSLEPELFETVRKLAEDQARSVSNTIAILIKRGLKDANVIK